MTAPNTIQIYPTLHKRGVKGEVRCWRMEIGFWDDEVAGHRVVSGILGGAETASGWTMPEGKNHGKKNATTKETQTISEVANNYAIKRSRGYFDDVNLIDEVPFTKPMLAQDWDKRKAKVKIEDGVFAQPKLDGMRCIARADGLWTRTGKPIVSCPHIVEALAPFFEDNPDFELDGELYNHEYRDRFNDLMSILRKEKPAEADLEESRSVVQYHIYDIVAVDQHFAGRRDTLIWAFENLFNRLPVLRRVETVFVSSADVLDKLYGDWMADGYEGQMIRLDAPYENKRSNTLMKRKDFVTEEFPILRMEEGNGNWAGAVKRFIIEIEPGNEGEATPRGTYATLAALLESDKCPDWGTIRHFGRTPDGKLRFPTAVDYGYGERVD